MIELKPLIFSAPQCGNCTVLKNNLKGANIDFTEVDVDSDEGRELAIKFGVRGLPTTLFIDEEGSVVKTIVGIKPSVEYL